MEFLNCIVYRFLVFYLVKEPFIYRQQTFITIVISFTGSNASFKVDNLRNDGLYVLVKRS